MMYKGLPKEVRVSSSIYKIIIKDKVYLRPNNTTECYGVCDSNNKTIELTRAYDNYNMTDILLHELVHAIWKEYKLSSKPTEEEVATAFGTALFNLFADNPKLKEYINKNTVIKQNMGVYNGESNR